MATGPGVSAPLHPQPAERWRDMLASYSADELVAGKLIQPDQWDFVMRIIRQQAHILLASNCYPSATSVGIETRPPAPAP